MPFFTGSKSYKILYRILSLAAVLSCAFINPVFAAGYSNIIVAPDMKEVTVETDTAFGETSNVIREKFFVRDLVAQKIPGRIQSFNLKAKYNNVLENIVECESVIDIPGGRNHSYGAFCSAYKDGKKKKIAVCDAEMTNAFKIQTIQNEHWTKPDLIKFVMNNCFGG